LTVAVAYFVRGSGETWAVIRLTGRDREDIVADGLSRDAAEELCFQTLEELPRGAEVAGELPLDGDIAQRHPRSRQLTLKLGTLPCPAWLVPGGVFVD
jgi:hypothetical protein